MRNVRYICLSDLHLGEEDSLLTDFRNGQRPSPALGALVDCLSDVVRRQTGAPKPGLILLGDIVELALCPSQQAFAAFELFLRTVMPANGELFDEIVYVPGNHDHHMWQGAREEQYLNYLTRLAPEMPIEPPWDTTKLVMDMNGRDRLMNPIATAVARRLPNLRDRNFEIVTAYPNFGLRAGARAAVFHHGHFIEPAYRLFSTLATLVFPDQTLPQDVYTLEKENAAWIDFFWSSLGSCGRVGGDIETIYEASATESSLRRITDTLAANIARQYRSPKWMPRIVREWLWRAVLHKAAGAISTGLERRQAAGEEPLSQESASGLVRYLEGPLQTQFQQEQGSAPESVTFVFGHTHKPFTGYRAGRGILNTGGWVVDAPAEQPLHGASAVLVAEDLAAVSIQCYREGDYEARVEEPMGPGAAHSEFYAEVRESVRYGPAWKTLGAIARREVELRAANLAQRLKCGRSS